MEFIEETEIAERSIRRLAQSRGTSVSRSGDSYFYKGIALSDNEVWDVLSSQPQVASRRGR